MSVTFAMLAFRAVKRGKVPDRCYRVVWGAALASATINFSHEYGKSGNALAGGYVALLSLFGMFMFDEFVTTPIWCWRGRSPPPSSTPTRPT